ncbi:MAG: helix-turn-helix transcriptional regulator [Chloroflexi bacterium]|nr:helix-turn-helix transcriptional regulator [Chloroflexota bacterium]
MAGTQESFSQVEARRLRLSLGRKLKRFRLSKGLSQEALADLAAFDRTYVGSVERGERNPTLLAICRFARALGIQPNELMPDLPREEAHGVQE